MLRPDRSYDTHKTLQVFEESCRPTFICYLVIIVVSRCHSTMTSINGYIRRSTSLLDDPPHSFFGYTVRVVGTGVSVRQKCHPLPGSPFDPHPETPVQGKRQGVHSTFESGVRRSCFWNLHTQHSFLVPCLPFTLSHPQSPLRPSPVQR